MQKEIVTVIIPAYNSSKTVSNALSSVINQEGDFNLEVIVIDDGSTDHTAQIVLNYSEKYPGLIKLVSQKNQGVACARNQGLKHATGDFIAFLDSDDCWYPNKLQKQLHILKNNDFFLLGGGYQGRFNSLNDKKDFFEVTYRMQLLKQYFQPSTVIFKKELLNKVHGFVEGRRYCEDALFFYQSCFYYRCGIIAEDVIQYGDGKHPYASGTGLGSHLWEMEKGELLNFKVLLLEKKIKFWQWGFLSMLSVLKFFRRVIIKFNLLHIKLKYGINHEK